MDCRTYFCASKLFPPKVQKYPELTFDRHVVIVDPDFVDAGAPGFKDDAVNSRTVSANLTREAEAIVRHIRCDIAVTHLGTVSCHEVKKIRVMHQHRII